MVCTHIAPKKIIGSDMRSMVEARRVELLSENRSIQLSPGGADYLHSLIRPPNGRLADLVAPGTPAGREPSLPTFTTK